MNKTYKKIKVKNKSLKNKINFVTNFIFENNNKFYNGLYKKDKNLKDSFIHLLLYNKNYRKKRKILLIPHSVRYYNNFNSLLVFEDLKSIFYNNPNKFKDYLIIFMTTSTQHKDKNNSSLCYSSNNYYGDYNCFKIGGKQVLNLLKFLREEYNVSKYITTFGYSDAGWLGSMLGYLGYVNKVITFSGFSFNNFDNWKCYINKNMNNRSFIFYFSLNDKYLNEKKDNNKGINILFSIIGYFNCKLIKMRREKIGNLDFIKYYFKNSNNNIEFKLYVDKNNKSNHNSLFKSKAHLTSLLRDL